MHVNGDSFAASASRVQAAAGLRPLDARGELLLGTAAEEAEAIKRIAIDESEQMLFETAMHAAKLLDSIKFQLNRSPSF
mgnify:CR=1 FL=1